MTVLVADTETTGFLLRGQPHTHPGQPHLVQLGVILLTDEGRELASADLTVRPDGWAIPDAAAKVHGITTEIALASGVPLAVACAVYTNLRARADLVVAHNWEFDREILAVAVHRTGRKPAHPGPAEWACTMQMASPVLALPPTNAMKAAGFTKHKPPNLGEAYRFLFDEELLNAHSAMADARACARVYFELRRREAVAAAVVEAGNGLRQDQP